MSDFSTLGARLAHARSEAGLRQTDVARALGLKHSIQVSKWENDLHAPGVRTLDKLADLYSVAVAWLISGYDYPSDNKNVSRGTVREGFAHAYPLARGIAQMATDLEREVIRLGATDFEVDYINAIIRSPETSKLLHTGGTANPLSNAEMEAEARSLIGALRHWVLDRIARRAVESGPEPIKPKDVPAAVRKRRDELEGGEGEEGSSPRRRTK